MDECILPGAHSGQQLPSFVMSISPTLQIGRLHKIKLQSVRDRAHHMLA